MFNIEDYKKTARKGAERKFLNNSRASQRYIASVFRLGVKIAHFKQS